MGSGDAGSVDSENNFYNFSRRGLGDSDLGVDLGVRAGEDSIFEIRAYSGRFG